MDHSIHVSPGDVWQPESANRFNRISDVLNRIGVIGPGTGNAAGSGGDAVIRCKNVSGGTIRANTYVTIGQPSSAVSDNVFSALYTMGPGNTDPCGVILDDCANGETADVQLSGLAEAEAPHPPHSFRIHGSGHSGRELVLLNTTGYSGYFNYFKVIPVKRDTANCITQIKIIDGGNPESSCCGMTDVSDVPAGTLEVSGKYICLRLKAETGSDGSFEKLSQCFEWMDSPPDEHSPCVILAEIVDRMHLIQRWTSGMIYWRNRFIVPFDTGGIE